MIWTNKFTIGHIGRTGGDATIFLVSAVLEAGPGTTVKLGSNLKMTANAGDDKHRPFNGSEPIRVLGIRRLPSFILSIRHYLMTYARVSPWTAEYCATLNNGDAELSRMTDNYKYCIDRWLRCEYLRDDLCALLTEAYGVNFTCRMKAVLYSAVTKKELPYNKNVFDFFTDEQLARLYNNNPHWAEYEKYLYGSILC